MDFLILFLLCVNSKIKIDNSVLKVKFLVDGNCDFKIASIYCVDFLHQYCSEYFMYMILLNPQNNPMRQELTLSSFLQMRKLKHGNVKQFA